VSLKDELAEPWGLLIGATAAGAAWAVHLPLAAAAGIGVAVYVTKAATSAWERRRRGIAGRVGRRQLGPGGAPALAVDPRSTEGWWLERARKARESFSELARGMAPGPLAERVAMMEPQVDDTIGTLARLAAQATAAGRALARIDGGGLDQEEARLRASRAAAGGDVAAELDRSLASIQAQREVRRRLDAARTGVLARLESGTLGLESLVARVVELSAIAASGPAAISGGTATVDQLGDELEGIRQGLAETEAVSRQALSAWHQAGEAAGPGDEPTT
jgi:hypothetical protein